MVVTKAKKGQLKIQQMAFVLLAITLLFALVGMMIIAYKFSGVKGSATELNEKNAMLLVAKLANSPEFTCGGSFNNKVNCVDADKVMVLKNNIDKYVGFWGVSNIEIRKIYPLGSGEIKCTMGNYPDCDVIRIISDEVMGIDASNFVSLCRKERVGSEVYDKCELAKLMVSYEKAT